MVQIQAKEKTAVFTISHSFNAPRYRLWDAWTDPQQLKQWFGPKGGSMVCCTVDLRPGGCSRFCIILNGLTMWGKWAYQEVHESEELVALVSFTDDSGRKILPHPGKPGWPRQVLSRVLFSEEGDKTTVTVRWEPYRPTGEEREVFEEGRLSMEEGWSDSFEQLEALLIKMQKRRPL